MKKQEQKKTVIVYVNPTDDMISQTCLLDRFATLDKFKAGSMDNCTLGFPETRVMPKDAAIYTKILIDKFLASNDTTFKIATVSTDVCILVDDYAPVKKYKVQFFYRDKKSTMPRVFKKFNESFHFIDTAISANENGSTQED